MPRAAIAPASSMSRGATADAGEASDTSRAAWVRAHARPIRSLTDPTDDRDLEFLAPLLAGRRIVQLGESSHGAAEFDEVKVRLVHFLHERLGYDVLAFESPLVECTTTGWRTADLPSRASMEGACGACGVCARCYRCSRTSGRPPARLKTRGWTPAFAGVTIQIGR